MAGVVKVNNGRTWHVSSHTEKNQLLNSGRASRKRLTIIYLQVHVSWAVFSLNPFIRGVFIRYAFL